MRLRHASGRAVHLSYGTSVHPAGNLAGIIADLDTYAVPVRTRLGVDVLGLSLWIPPPVAASLAVDTRARRRLRAELDARSLEVVTLNGVPYRPAESKIALYRPDWTGNERLHYTLDLARILVDLLPDDAVRGSVSTVPLGWREPWGPGADQAVARMLERLCTGLTEIAWQTGRAVRVGLQPQPGCVVDSTRRAVELLSAFDTDRLGVCLDLAALACAWEEPADALALLRAGNIGVVKVGIGAAVEVRHPVAAADLLRGYVEPRYPHQTCSPSGEYADDLDEALATMPPGPWRVRYELPLHAVAPEPLTATTGVWQAALGELMSGAVPACDHLDVETQTWEVLPIDQRPTGPRALVDGVAAELAFARDVLLGLGLASGGRRSPSLPEPSGRP